MVSKNVVVAMAPVMQDRGALVIGEVGVGVEVVSSVPVRRPEGMVPENPVPGTEALALGKGTLLEPVPVINGIV